jgi:hypothetical protein
MWRSGAIELATSYQYGAYHWYVLIHVDVHVYVRMYVRTYHGRTMWYVVRT